MIAVWTVEKFLHHVWLYEDEGVAAEIAVEESRAGDCAVLGVQYPDGRVVPVAEWEAFQKEYDLQSEEERTIADAAPPRVTRKVRLPFDDNRVVEIESTRPEWVGLPLEPMPGEAQDCERMAP